MQEQKEETIGLLNSMNSYIQQIYKDNLQLTIDLKDKEETSPFRPPFSINYLEYYGTQEPTTSWIIRHIFAYTYNGKHPYWESFATTFLQQIGFRTEWIESPIIDKDHEYKSIDILVRDNKYAVIIENKLKGAEFQLNQLARYVATMRKEGYQDDQIFVVVLPKYEKTCLKNSVWRLPDDSQSPNLTRKCRVDDYTSLCDKEDFIPQDYCIKCELLKDSFSARTIFVQKELSEWLYNLIENNTENLPEDEIKKQYVLRSAIYQFVDFLNYIYKTRESKKYKMDIHNFLSDKLDLDKLSITDQLSKIEDRIDDAEELVSKLDELYWDKIKEYISEISTKHKVHLEKEDTNELYFNCKVSIDGISLVLSLGFEKSGGNYCQIDAKRNIIISEVINNDFEILEELNDKSNTKNCIWKWDSYKESLLRFDRVLGRLLVIQKAKSR